MIIFKDIHTQIYVYICISLDIHVYIDILHNTSYIYFIRIYNTHHIYMCTIYRYIMYTVYVNIRHTLAYTNSYPFQKHSQFPWNVSICLSRPSRDALRDNGISILKVSAMAGYMSGNQLFLQAKVVDKAK